MMFVLVAYDIRDDKRRRRCEKELSSYGRRVNYSVFELEISRSELLKLKNILEKESSKKEDNIRFYILNKEVLEKSFILHTTKKIFDEENLYF